MESEDLLNIQRSLGLNSNKIKLNQLIYTLFLKIMTPVYIIVLCFVYIPLALLLFSSHQQLCTVIRAEVSQKSAPLSRELFAGDKKVANEILVDFESFLDQNFVKSDFSFHEVNSNFKGQRGFTCESSIMSVRFSKVFTFANQKLGLISGEVRQFSFWWFVAITFGIGLVITISFYLFRKRISYELNRNVFSPLRSTLDEKVAFDKEKNREEKNQEMIKLAKQISHDIRSPLVALRSITSELESLDSISKKIFSNSVGRINEITNGLLKPSLNSTSLREIINLQILIEELILEKNFEKKIQIQYKSKTNYENSFVMGNSVELYRAFSNIINNAYEAYGEDDLPIYVTLDVEDRMVILSISDTASGMSHEILEKALIGGFSTKLGGNGLGLSYAKNVIEQHQGSFMVQTVPEKGTSIHMRLTTVKTPDWFLGRIEIKGDRVICIDDDESFLNLYQQKFISIKEELLVGNEQFFLNLDLGNEDQVFIDYDLGNLNGLELISEKNWFKNITLVTSFYNELVIQEACTSLGVKILPKQIFNKVKIFSKRETTVNAIKSYILIDDDPLIRLMWENAAKKEEKKLITYERVSDFIKEEALFSKNAKIIIDSQLGEGLKGEEEAEKIFKCGFKNIILATGYSKEDVNQTPWIKEIRGKRPDFS